MRLPEPLGPVCVLTLITFSGCTQESDPTRVGVAASLSDVMPNLQSQFIENRRLQGEDVDLSLIYGGSGELIAQQRHGGLFDAMFLASRESMIPLIDAGRLDSFSNIRLGNTLGLVASNSRLQSLSAEPSTLENLLQNGEPIGIGSLGVPAGDYARVWLGSIDGLELSDVNLIEFPNVRAVLAAVEGGAVASGFVYATDFLGRDGLSTIAEWRPEDGGPEYGYAYAEGEVVGADFGGFIGENLEQFVSAGFTVLVEEE